MILGIFVWFLKARRALRALRGLVKLQALVRGHNVRKQANMTLRYMQALLRVQARVRDQRLRVSNESSSKSSFSDNNSFWQSRCLQEMAERKSIVSSLISYNSWLFVSSNFFLFFLSFFSREMGVALQMIGTTAHTRLRKSKPCCRAERKQL